MSTFISKAQQSLLLYAKGRENWMTAVLLNDVKRRSCYSQECCHCSHLVNFEYFTFSEFPRRQASHYSKRGTDAHPLPSRALPSPDTDCSWHLKMLTVRSNTHLLCKCMERAPLSSCSAPAFLTLSPATAQAVLPSPANCFLTFRTFCWMLLLAIIIGILRKKYICTTKQ